MEFFEKMGDTIVSVGKDVSKKAKDASGIAKLKMDIRAKEDFIKKEYMEIGKSYYETYKGEAVKEQAHFDRIDEAMDAISKMELQILELKGAKKCPQCQAQAPDTAEFCSACGAKLSVVVEDFSCEEETVEPAHDCGEEKEDI